MRSSGRMTLLVLIAVGGCSDGNADRASVPPAAAPSVSRNSQAAPVPDATASFLEYSFQKPDGTESSNRIGSFSEADILAAMNSIPWSEGRFATIQISHDGANTISVFRNSEDDQSGGQIIAQLAKQSAGEWSFLNSPPLRDAAQGRDLLLSFYRKDGKHETLVKWTRVE